MFSIDIYNSFSYRSERQNGVFPLWWGLQDWLHSDDPLTKHCTWFLYCVYVRYVKECTVIPNAQQLQSVNEGQNCVLT